MRVQVNLSDEMNERAKFYAQKYGVTKSQLCSMLIGQGLLAYDKAIDAMSVMGDILNEQFKKSIETDNTNK